MAVHPRSEQHIGQGFDRVMTPERMSAVNGGAFITAIQGWRLLRHKVSDPSEDIMGF